MNFGQGDFEHFQKPQADIGNMALQSSTIQPCAGIDTVLLEKRIRPDKGLMTQSATVLQGRLLEDEFCQYVKALNGDIESRVKGSLYLAGSPAARDGKTPEWSMAPKVFDTSATSILKEAAETMYSIMVSATNHYLKDPEFRKEFNLPSRFEPFTAIPSQTGPSIPLARVDVFFNEETGDFQFCETNTDGSAGFTATDEVTLAIEQSASFALLKEKHPGLHSIHLRHEWCRKLVELYGNWAMEHNRKPMGENPTIALVDYLESLEQNEAKDFVRLLNISGFRARISDIRELHTENRNGVIELCDNEGPLDCVWKRAVTGELFQKFNSGVESLAQTIRHNLAYVAGGFYTWPAATKTFFAILHSGVANRFLSPEQLDFVERHVPKTQILDRETDIADLAANQKQLIAKPSDGYNAIGVIAGASVSREEWVSSLMRLAESGGVAQRYATQYATPMVRGDITEGISPYEFPDANNLLGLFLFGGRFAGVFPRCGLGRVIGEHQGRFEQGCLFVE